MKDRFLDRPFYGRERQSALSLSFLGAVLFWSFLPRPLWILAVSGVLFAGSFRFQRHREWLLFAAAGLALAGIAGSAAPFWRLLGEALENTRAARALESLRDGLSDRLGALEEASFFRSVLLGEAVDLPEETVQAFRVTGTRHLLALSGLHVSVVLGFFALVPSALPGGRRKNVLLILMGLGYLLLTGVAHSAARSVAMVAFTYSGYFSRRKNDPLNALFFAAVLILFFEPGALGEASFLLTFFATLGILVLARPALRQIRRTPYPFGFFPRLLHRAGVWLLSAFVVTLSAQIAIFPLLVLTFREISLFEPLFNLILVPALPILLAAAILFLLFSFFGAGAPFAAAADCLADGFLSLVRFLAGTGGLYAVSPGAARAFAVLTGLFLLAFFLFRPKIRYLPLFLPLELAGLFLCVQLFPA